MSDRIWITKDGDEILISTMDNQHLINSYKLLRGKGAVSPGTVEFYRSTAGPDGEMAQQEFEREFMSVIRAPVSIHMGWLEAELAKRNIDKWEI